MRLTRRLIWLLILLMVMAISFTIGYSILFIRDYMFQDRQEAMMRYAEEMMVYTDITDEALIRATQRHRYTVVLHHKHLDSKKWDSQDSLYVRQSDGKRTLQLAYSKEKVLEELRPIRWIIYKAMFISIILVAVVSIIFSVTVTRPIVRIKNAVEKIATRSPEMLERDADRKDEIGMIARAINHVSQNLRQDNQRLKVLYERQAQFYQDVAHELNNPLHAMNGAVEMLALKADDPEARARYLDIVRRHQQRMEMLVKDILALQNAEAPDAPTPSLRPLELHTQLADTLSSWQASYAQRGIALLGTPGQRLTVLADPHLLQQVLDNLLANALKYTEKGEVELGARPITDGSIEVYVRDTGIGIAPEHIPHLTERFYRTDKARSRDQGGTGLGLSIVQSLLQRMDSSLNIASTAGTGSTFSFVLQKA